MEHGGKDDSGMVVRYLDPLGIIEPNELFAAHLGASRFFSRIRPYVLLVCTFITTLTKNMESAANSPIIASNMVPVKSYSLL
jgi:hypothetical protein